MFDNQYMDGVTQRVRYTWEKWYNRVLSQIDRLYMHSLTQDLKEVDFPYMLKLRSYFVLYLPKTRNVADWIASKQEIESIIRNNK